MSIPYGQFAVKSIETNKVLAAHAQELKDAPARNGYPSSYFEGAECKVHMGDNNGDVMLIFGFKRLPMVRFSIRRYPVCCGIMMLHTFAIYDAVSQELLDEVLSTFFKENSYHSIDEGSRSYLLGHSGRIEVVMVETRGGLTSPSPDMDVPEVADPVIAFKPLWNFFHKHAKKVRTRLQYNSNSGNILHNMEVIF